MLHIAKTVTAGLLALLSYCLPLSSQTTGTTLAPGTSPGQTNNYIDDFIFGRMKHEGIPHASLASDEEFLRRVYLDLTGRLALDPDQIRDFLRSSDPGKRDKLIDKLTDTSFEAVTFDHPTFPFLDRWTYFFCDLLENEIDQVGYKGRNLFWDHINAALLLNTSYKDLVIEMMTATAASNWLSGPSNFLARYHADDMDGVAVNHEDTIEDIAISATRNFLGVNVECIACHDGAGHLDKINLWLSSKQRQDFWKHSSFFGEVRIRRAFGIGQEFTVLTGPHRYDLTHPSVERVPRYNKDTSPAFLLTGELAIPGENLRHAFARMLTSNPQFARATVNLLWAEMMGIGIVDPPLEFDLARQDPQHPPPSPWTIQPSHPELLAALARDFVEHNYDLRYIIKLIAKSKTYQLSSRFRGEWKPAYAQYFARRHSRRLSAEQLYDAISEATKVFVDIQISGTTQKVKYAMQTRGPGDFTAKGLETEQAFLASFGQSNRDQGRKSLKNSIVQSSLLLNGKFVRDRVRADKGRLKTLLEAQTPKTDDQIIEELYLVTLGRFPTVSEKQSGLAPESRSTAAENLLWGLLNTREFLFY